MRQFIFLLGLSFFATVTCSKVASEKCNQGSTCMNLPDVIPYSGSSTRNVTRTRSMKFTSDDLRSFYTSITKGDAVKIDQRVRFEPFNEMDKHLLNTPYAVALMAQLSLIGTKRDYDMSGLMEYKVLVAPGSFRASLGQVGNEAFTAFRKANKAMYSIELLTSQFKGQLNKILRIVFRKNSDKGILFVLPSVLNRTLSIVEDSHAEIKSVVAGFNGVQEVLNEIFLASLIKQRKTDEFNEYLTKQREEKEERKKELENKELKEQERIDDINRQIKEKTRFFDEAKKNLTKEEQKNSVKNKLGNAKSMKLTMHSFNNGYTSCGGEDVAVRLKQDSIDCQTNNHGSGSFSSGQTLHWDEMGDCDSKEFDLNNVFIHFYLIANSTDHYCPNRLSVDFKAVDSRAGEVSYISEEIDTVVNNDDNGILFRARRDGGSPDIPEWDDYKNKTHVFDPIVFQRDPDKKKNEGVRISFKETLQETFKAMNLYFHDSQSIQIVEIKKWIEYEDPNSIDTVISNLKQGMASIDKKRLEFDGDVKFGITTKLMLHYLTKICEEVKEKVNANQTESSQLYKRYSQKKNEMTLLSEFRLKEFDNATKVAHQQINKALTELGDMIKSEFRISPDDKLQLVDDSAVEEKIEKLKASIDEVNYKHDNDDLGDDLMKYLNQLEKIVGMVGNDTIIDQATSDFKTVQKKVQNTEKANAISNLGSLLKKPSPERFAAEREKTFTAYGSNAKAIVNAKIKVETAKRELNHFIQLQEEAGKTKDFYHENLKKAIRALGDLAQKASTNEEILDVIKKALKVFADLKEAWNQLLVFFDEMSVNIKTAMGAPMRDLCTTSKNLMNDTFTAQDRISYGRDLLFHNVFESSTMSYIIQKQAGLYHTVSRENLMPVVNRLPKLLVLDSVTDEAKIKEEYDNIHSMVKNAQDDIKAKCDETSAAFQEEVKARIIDLETLWNNLTISNPVVNDPTIIKESQDVMEKVARYSKDPTIGLADNEDYDFGIGE